MYDKFVRRFPHPGDLVRESPETLHRVVGSLGLRWRVPLMLKMAERILVDGKVPTSLDRLTKLPGVGPYAAGAFLSMHSGVRAHIIDSNVVRWLGRVLALRTDPETRRKSWFIALVDDLTPQHEFREFNYAMLDLAMRVCRAKPECDQCPLSTRVCAHRRANSPHQKPERQGKPTEKRRD